MLLALQLLVFLEHGAFLALGEGLVFGSGGHAAGAAALQWSQAPQFTPLRHA